MIQKSKEEREEHINENEDNGGIRKDEKVIEELDSEQVATGSDI